jgi:hypothetical protein
VDGIVFVADKCLLSRAQSTKTNSAIVTTISGYEQTVQPFEMWFYASLGSVDLARVTAAQIADARQPAKIRAALDRLPGEAAERHLSQFANNLFTRASEAKPELKQRYLKSGFEIVGDHKLAREARKLHDYYADLITEIKLETRLDGADVVGHGKPFGVFVNLVHTKEIERESGGFGKYLQNQNNSQMFFYNFGRPLENYRDKFRDFAIDALGEHFEVLSVTFQEASVNSRASAEYGWRSTPYAYLLLKAKGPEIGKLAPLRMDLDFLDTSGYAVLPIESPALPLDARAEAPPPRPATELVVTQTLDERQAEKGKLLLDIRAVARGIAPDLNEMLDLRSPGFEIEKIEDQGPSVLEFDKEASEIAVRSERQWLISMVANTAAEQRPTNFRFGAAKLPVKEMIFQRYDDADLKPAEAEVSLESRYGDRSGRWLLLPISVGLLVMGAAFGIGRLWARRRTPPLARFALPAELTPFTAIGFLRDLHDQANFDDATRSELSDSFSAIERHYFQSPQPEAPDVKAITPRWLAAALARE